MNQFQTKISNTTLQSTYLQTKKNVVYEDIQPRREQERENFMRLNQLVGRHVPKPSKFKPDMDLPPIKVVVTGAAG